MDTVDTEFHILSQQTRHLGVLLPRLTLRSSGSNGCFRSCYLGSFLEVAGSMLSLGEAWGKEPGRRHFCGLDPKATSPGAASYGFLQH